MAPLLFSSSGPPRGGRRDIVPGPQGPRRLIIPNASRSVGLHIANQQPDILCLLRSQAVLSFSFALGPLNSLGGPARLYAKIPKVAGTGCLHKKYQ